MDTVDLSATPRPHDLLLAPEVIDVLTPDTPDWVAPTLRRTPWVVVRRSAATTTSIAVGVRGQHRSQRHGLMIPRRVVRLVRTPEFLGRQHWTRDLPALRTLDALRPAFAGMRWGPTGSVGFELATGSPTVTATSDLDLVVRIDSVIDAQHTLRELAGVLETSVVRVDCQVETCCGAVSLAELVSSATEVLVRTHYGPVLMAISELRR